ncbi:MAG TPA: helix-turn-helix domain-containing protein [Pseudonocardia sp.]|jgi:AcrR family transcriptional regulator|nr:helix-turn-helix domain-containing protein [Pseudonocardia sp.]
MIAATMELLHEGGWNAATPAAIAERAGAGKMSLYRHFTGRDDVVNAALVEFDRAQRDWLLGPPDAAPAHRILGAFDRVAERIERGELGACPFVSTRLQIGDGTHPVADTALRHKRQTSAELARVLECMGHPSPVATGEAVLLLLDGAIVHAAMQGDARPVRVAKQAAATLLGVPLEPNGG